jgi:hypothetical protein
MPQDKHKKSIESFSLHDAILRQLSSLKKEQDDSDQRGIVPAGLMSFVK